MQEAMSEALTAPSAEELAAADANKPEPITERRSTIPNVSAPAQKVIEVNTAGEQINAPEPEVSPELTDNVVISATGTVQPAAHNEGWIDQSDMDAKEAIAAENLRLQKLRQQRSKPAPPHAAAARTARNLSGVPVMDPSATQTETAESESDEEGSEGSSKNPKFKPPGR